MRKSRSASGLPDISLLARSNIHMELHCFGPTMCPTVACRLVSPGAVC